MRVRTMFCVSLCRWRVYNLLRCQLIDSVASQQVAHVVEAASEQDARSQIAAQTDGTEDDDRLVGRYFVEMFAQIVEWNIDSSLDGFVRTSSRNIPFLSVPASCLHVMAGILPLMMLAAA